MRQEFICMRVLWIWGWCLTFYSINMKLIHYLYLYYLEDAGTYLNGFLLGNYKWTRKTDQKSQDFKRYTDVTVVHKDLKLDGKMS